MNHSLRATLNMTNQMAAQLTFLVKNRAKKQKRLERVMKWRIYKLPGFGKMTRAMEAGLAKVTMDIKNKEIEIKKMQDKGQIFKII